MRKNLKDAFWALLAALALSVNPVSAASKGDLGLDRLQSAFVFTDGLLPACAFIMMFMLIRRAPKHRTSFCAFICGLIFTTAQMFANGNTDVSALASPARACLTFILLLGAWVVFDNAITWFTVLIDRLKGDDGQVSRLKTALVLFVCWMPYIIIAWPGTLHADTLDQIGQFMGTFFGKDAGISLTAEASEFSRDGILINDTQPVIYTLFTGGVFALTKWLGNENLTPFVIGAVQLIIGSLAVSRALCLLSRLGMRKKWVRLLTAFFALFPVFPMYFAATLKDAFFALMLLAYLTFALEIHAFTAKTLADKRRITVGIIAGILCALSRGFGIWLTVLTLPGIFASLKNADKHVISRAAKVFAVPVAAYVLITFIVYPCMGVGKGPAGENMSMMVQQTALCVKEYPEEVTDEEKAVIDAALGFDTLAARYNPEISDSVKQEITRDGQKLSEYKRAWLEMFGKQPGAYLRAGAAMAANYWDLRTPAANKTLLTYLGTDMGKMRIGELYRDTVHIATPKTLLEICRYAVSAIRVSAGIPVIALLYKSGLYLFALIFMLHANAKRKTGGRSLLWTLLLYGIMLALGPISGSTRYAFALFVCVPLTGTGALMLPERRA